MTVTKPGKNPVEPDDSPKKAQPRAENKHEKKEAITIAIKSPRYERDKEESDFFFWVLIFISGRLAVEEKEDETKREWRNSIGYLRRPMACRWQNTVRLIKGPGMSPSPCQFLSFSLSLWIGSLIRTRFYLVLPSYSRLSRVYRVLPSFTRF